MTRIEIAEMLRLWQAGLLRAEQVHEWAEERYFPGEISFDDENGEEPSVCSEVMSALDNLDMNLIVVDDVPLYLEFLATPSGGFEEGYRKFQKALDRIDILARQKELASIPLYAPFCR